MRRVVRWAWVNLPGLAVVSLALVGVYFFVAHIGLPAHYAQGERQIINVERLTRLETLVEAKTDDRFRGSDHRAWVEELGRLNPSLKLPE